MFPRHGHDDFDQKGSVVTKHISGVEGAGKSRGRNALTVAEMEALVLEACNKPDAVAKTGATKLPPYKHSLDFAAWTDKHIHPQLLNSTYGHTQRTMEEVCAGVPRKASIKCFRVYKDEEGVIRVKFKMHQQDKLWVGADKDGRLSSSAPGTRLFKSKPGDDEYPPLGSILPQDKWQCDTLKASIYRATGVVEKAEDGEKGVAGQQDGDRLPVPDNTDQPTEMFTDEHRAGRCNCCCAAGQPSAAG
jgi:hypothetical protein